MNTFDLDGVISVGIHPGPGDVIITGRSFEEAPETYRYLHSKGIYNAVFFNPLPFDKKTRETSGNHKAATIIRLLNRGNSISVHFEDDEIQMSVIQKALEDAGVTGITVVHVVHDLTEKENVRHEFK